LEQLEEHDDVAIQWHSFELRPAGSPPMSAERRARIIAGRPQLQRRAREQYGLEMNPGPFDTNSRPALVLEKYAQSQGKGAAFHVAVMRAYWEQARDIGDPATLREIAEQVGLNTKDFEQILHSEAFDGQVTADIEQAYEYGMTGVPALVFADRYLVMGAQPYQVLKQVIERVRAEEKGGGEVERE
jgi:predicted DsbA family dithiol-disulfide isomerase